MFQEQGTYAWTGRSHHNSKTNCDFPMCNPNPDKGVAVWFTFPTKLFTFASLYLHIWFTLPTKLFTFDSLYGSHVIGYWFDTNLFTFAHTKVHINMHAPTLHVNVSIFVHICMHNGSHFMAILFTFISMLVHILTLNGSHFTNYALKCEPYAGKCEPCYMGVLLVAS